MPEINSECNGIIFAGSSHNREGLCRPGNSEFDLSGHPIKRCMVSASILLEPFMVPKQNVVEAASQHSARAGGAYRDDNAQTAFGENPLQFALEVDRCSVAHQYRGFKA